MRTTPHYVVSIAATLALAIAVTACEEGEPDEAGIALDEGAARGDALAVMAEEDLGPQSETVTIGMAGEILLAIDDAEIAHATLVRDRLIVPEAFDYANQMIAAHSAHAADVAAMLSFF